MTMLMAFLAFSALSSCSEEVVADKQESQEVSPDLPEGITEFSTADDATRTSLDPDAKFYWADNDNIWVDVDGNDTFSKGNIIDKTELFDDNRKAKFYFTGTMNKGSYNLTYTGTNSTSGTTVTIAAEQVQAEPDKSEHIGSDGDCATAVASPNSKGKYTFTLQHKAHYLIFQPYKDDDIGDEYQWDLVDIEIIELDGKPLSGTYAFGMGGLDASSVQNAKSTLKLTIGGTEGFRLPRKSNWETKKTSWYAVIAPTSDGSNHRLRIKYRIKTNGEINYYNGVSESEDFVIIKDVNIASAPNKVTKIAQKMTVERFPTSLFYMWDAAEGEYYWKSVSNPPTYYGASATGHPTSGDARYTTYTIPSGNGIRYDATKSCKSLPNVNAATWYAMAGDPRWETEYPWVFDYDYGHIYTRGTWFKKWDVIVAENSVHFAGKNSTMTGCDVSFKGTSVPIYNSDRAITEYRNYTGTDYRSTEFPSATWFQSRNPSYRDGGRPADITNYFFLPANGHLNNGALLNTGGIHGCYWLSSAVPKKYPTIATSLAYIMETKYFALQVRGDNGAVPNGRPVFDWK